MNYRYWYFLKFRPQHLSGFSLVEVTMALGIFAFAVIAISGMLTVSVKKMGDSKQELQAANLATRILEDYRSSMLNGGPSRFGLPAASDLTPSQLATNVLYLDESGLPGGQDQAAYRLRYQVEKLPGSRDRVRVSLIFGWPAGAQQPQITYEVSGLLAPGERRS